MSDLGALTAAIERQAQSIDALCEHIALLAQSVAMLLGEEMGTPAEEAQEGMTMDGEQLKFRGSRD